MGNVFKSVANFLDKAISGKEVDVIVLEEKPLDASVAGELVAGETGGLVTGELVTGAAADENAGDGGEGAVGGEGDEGADGGEGADAGGEAAGDDGGESAGGESAGGETPSPSAATADRNAQGDTLAAGLRQAQPDILGEGEVAIGAAELEQLRADAGEWVANKAELTQLRAWKANGSKPNVMNGAVDAADAVSTPPKKVSAATQKAIDLKNKMAGG